MQKSPTFEVNVNFNTVIGPIFTISCKREWVSQFHISRWRCTQELFRLIYLKKELKKLLNDNLVNVLSIYQQERKSLSKGLPPLQNNKENKWDFIRLKVRQSPIINSHWWGRRGTARELRRGTGERQRDLGRGTDVLCPTWNWRGTSCLSRRWILDVLSPAGQWRSG